MTDLEDQLARLAADVAATGPDGPTPTTTPTSTPSTAYGEVQHRFETLGGYGVEAEARRVLAGLGFSHDDGDRPVQDLSGGWRMRVALARLMLSSPDLLVLDEPTNHLDVESVAWLEQHLQSWPGAILFVSHDRDFIDAVAERVVEVADGHATEYVGGFAEFVVQREDRLAAARGRGVGPGAPAGPRRAVHRALPLQGHQGPPGAEPHQDPGAAGAAGGRRPPRS